VAKVKKDGAVRRARSGKTKTPSNAPSGARHSAPRRGVGGSRRRQSTARAAIPVARFRVTPLNPQEKCGAETSVQQLFRISEESADGIRRLHLVFLDRHGWYCEHGRECPAVPYAKKFR
jgi:hypothetical protein